MKRIQAVLAASITYIRRGPRIIGEHAFPAFLVLVLLSVIISGSIFALIIFSLANAEPDTQNSQTAFREATFLAILDIWKEREVRFQAAGVKTYKNLFEVRP